MAFGFLVCQIALSAQDKRPNILLVVADDMGWSDAGAYGGEIFTPNINRLASRGYQFLNFHVGSMCAPTRSMLMTGVDNHVVGLGNMVELLADNQRGKPGYEGKLNGRAVTMASLLQKAGYHTYMAGKWHLGYTPETLPASQGFEQSFVLAEGGADNYEKKSYSPNYTTPPHFFDGLKEAELPPDFYSSRSYTDKMLGWIDDGSSDGKPFFAYLAFQAVHMPLQVPAEYTDRYLATYQAGWSKLRSIRYQRQVDMGISPAGLTLVTPKIIPDWNSMPEDERRMDAKRMAVYAGMLEYMDMSIGRVLDHLKQKGVLDNTIVIFMSDNGGEAHELMDHYPDYYAKNFNMTYEHMGQKTSFVEYGPAWAMVSMTPFSNFKSSAGEGGVRAPLLISYPKSIPAGQRTDAFASVVDVVPTLLEFAGVQPSSNSAPLSGRSMAGLLTGTSQQVYPSDVSISQELSGGAAVYQGGYKLARNIPPYGDRKWHLYNLQTDPMELKDIAADEPDRVKSMSDAYADYVSKNGVVEVPDDYDIAVQATKNAQAKHSASPH
ncbi:arylsulfatase [Occallatibacter riparius]|uniref:Arylsulfatase n=1 Tax=Occallatibacter riparius TaxID=1002689 RepID=A0A9J7BKK1_9BACT|nr:arylsulfatase [Occallatibacter riparius]UWZ83404.1 arylsulfatase [Occallatibacter riparius]